MTPSTPLDDATVGSLADRLCAASRTGIACAPVRDTIAADDAAGAYAVQQQLAQRRVAGGASVVGRKIGLTSPAVQQQLGVDQPDFGILFDDMGFQDGDAVPIGALLQPKVEAEIAFILGADLAEGPLDAAQVRGAVAAVLPALEIVDSRIAHWDITFVDTVADNGSSALYVLGQVRRTLDEIEPVDVEMTMFAGDAEVSSGTGAACLGDPLTALAWLARTALDFGQPLRAGDLVLSGALGPMYPIRPGEHVRAELRGLGTVSASFTAGSAGSPTGAAKDA